MGVFSAHELVNIEPVFPNTTRSLQDEVKLLPHCNNLGERGSHTDFFVERQGGYKAHNPNPTPFPRSKYLFKGLRLPDCFRSLHTVASQRPSC